MEDHSSFGSLLIVVFLAFIVPLVLLRFRRLRLPIVVGEILAGILIGGSGLKLINAHDPLLQLLSEFGFVFLMFLSGMEIDFSSLSLTAPRPGKSTEPRQRRQWGPVPLGALSFGITLVLALAVGTAFTVMGLVSNPWMMALILSTTSLGVVVPVLKETGLNSGRFGQALLVAALIADFATMLLITVVVAMLSHGLTLDILLIGGLFVAFFLLLRFGLILNRSKPVRRMMEELSHATAQIKFRAALTIMLALVVLSNKLGTEVILGAFLAGAIVSLLRTKADSALTHKLDAMGFGFLIPIFFIKVGIDFDLTALLTSPKGLLLVPLLLISAIAIKLIAAQVFRLSFTGREALAAGVLLSARLSLIIAASAIGVRLGIIGQEVNAAIILVAILTVAGAPLAFVRLTPGRKQEEQQIVIVVGAGELGLQVAQQLVAHHEPVVVIDPDSTRVARAGQLKMTAVVGDVGHSDAELGIYLDRARVLVCTYADAERSYRVCEQARNTYGIQHVVAQVSDPIDLGRFKQLGVTTMNAALDRAALLAMLARNPATYELLTRTDDDKEVFEVTITSTDHAGLTLRQLALPGDVLVLALRRDGELLVPHGNTQLDLDDCLTLVGSLTDVETAQQLFGANRGGRDAKKNET